MMKIQNHKVEALSWWALLFMLYLLLLSSLSAVEIVVGAAVAALVSGVAIYARAAEQVAFRFRLHWCRWLPALLVDVVLDTVALAALLSRCLRGVCAEQGHDYYIQLPPEPDPRAAHTRSAIAAILLSIAPGSYVVDSSTGEKGADTLTIHCVGGHGCLAEAMRR